MKTSIFANVMDETGTYYADFLKKEDLSGKWRLYWASLNAKGIYFRQEKTAPEQNDNFQQFIELTPGSRCVLAKRRMYSFRFKLITAQGHYTLKCESILQRYRWMYMIDLVVNGRPREPPPNALNRADIIDGMDYNTNSIDEKDSRNQYNSVMKSKSFTRSFSLKSIRVWKKRRESLPPTRCLRKKENPSNDNLKKTADIHSSFNFAENLAYFDD